MGKVLRECIGSGHRTARMFASAPAAKAPRAPRSVAAKQPGSQGQPSAWSRRADEQTSRRADEQTGMGRRADTALAPAISHDACLHVLNLGEDAAFATQAIAHVESPLNTQRLSRCCQQVLRRRFVAIWCGCAGTHFGAVFMQLL